MSKSFFFAAVMALCAFQASAQQIDPALLQALSPADISAIERQIGDNRPEVAPSLPSADQPTAAVQPMLAPASAATEPTSAAENGVVQTYFRALTGQTLPVHGRDLFLLDLQQGTFMFNSVGLDYRVAPGDQLRIVTRGLKSEDTIAAIDRDGTLTVAELLPLAVSGQTIPEVRQTLTEALRIDDQSAEVALSLASARLVPVQFTGFVATPQTLAIPAYTPLSVALSMVGGIAPDGTLRSVKVFVPGEAPREVDLYGLANGLSDFDDVLLTERARVHVEGIGPTVAVTGFAASAAIFELQGDQQSIAVRDLLALASVGRLPIGATLEVVRLDQDGLPQSERIAQAADLRIRQGEALHVGFRGLRDLDRVEVAGAVLDPRKTAYAAGLTLYDLLKGGAALRPEADPDVALIRNTSPEQEPRLVSLRRALSAPESVTIAPGDIVHVFTRNELSEMMARLAASDLPSGDVLADSIRRASPALVMLDDNAVALMPGGSVPEDSLRLTEILRNVDLYADFAQRIFKPQQNEIRRASRFDLRSAWFGERITPLQAGEVIKIYSVDFIGLRDLAMIELAGAVLDPRKAAYAAGLTLYDLLKGGASLRPEADPDVALIRNTSPEQEPRLVSLRRALSAPESVTIAPGDIVHVFTRSELSEMMARLAASDLPLGEGLFASLQRAEPALVLLDGRPVALLPAGSLPSESLRLTSVLRSIDLYSNYAHRIARPTAASVRRTSAFDPQIDWFGPAPTPLGVGEQVQLFSVDFIRGFAGRLGAASESLADVAEVVQSQVAIVDQLIADDLQRVTGAVQFPGLYPFVGAVSLQAALDAAGGLLSSGDSTGVTVRQLSVRGDALALDGARRIDLARVDPAAFVMRGRFDIFVPALANDAFIGTVQVQGEVRKPGEYAVSRGETLGDVIRRAGGLTSTAYPLGAVFTRRMNTDTERATYKRLADQIRQLVIGLSQAEREGAADQIAAVIAFADQIENAPVTGRQVITLGAGGAAERIELVEGDRLTVPSRPSFVRIIGAVQSEVSTQFVEGRQAVDYLADAGGTTEIADLARSFLILPNGQSQPLNLRNAKNAPVPPGSVIVVPPKLDRLSPLALTEIIASVLGNIATSILAFDTISGR